jgi:hypothetical protein
MTQIQKTTPWPKESKAKSFLVNILVLKSDSIVLTLEQGMKLVGWGMPSHSPAKATMAKGLPLPACFLGPGVRKRAERRGSGQVQTTGSLNKEAGITKDDNLRTHRQSLLPSPPGPDGELVPCGTGHPCNSAPFECLSGCSHSTLWVHIGPTCLVPHGAGLIKHIPASPSSMLWVRC